MSQFEYLVCTAQQNRVTFVNGQWQGRLAPRAPGALESCPKVWDFLQALGQEEWDLITVATDQVADQAANLTTLYLKRERSDEI